MNIQLPLERGIQLKSFAERQNLGVVEAIGALLRLANAADTVPGFTVEAIQNVDEQRYRFSFDGFAVELKPVGAFNIAMMIDQMLEDPGKRPRRLLFEPQARELSIGRGRGASFVIIGRNTATTEVTTKRLSLDVAKDLALQIRNVLPRGPTS